MIVNGYTISPEEEHEESPIIAPPTEPEDGEMSVVVKAAMEAAMEYSMRRRQDLEIRVGQLESRMVLLEAMVKKQDGVITKLIWSAT